MSKLKVLHSAALLTPSSGMLKQMQWEQEAADQMNIDWQAVMYCPSGINESKISEENKKICHFDKNITHTNPIATLKKIQNWYHLRKNYYLWLSQQTCDIHLLRYYVHDVWQYQFIRNINKPVLLVHHSFEVPELLLPGNFSAKLRGLLESKIGVKSINSATGIIGVTDEIAHHELARLKTKRNKKYFVYPNGYNFTNQPTLTDNRDSKTVNLLFIASYFDPWHGLDLLIQNIEKSTLPFNLHIVGNLPEDLAIRISNDTRLIAHGLLNSNEINSLVTKCDVGLSSFALFRKDMHQACTLKVREYLSLGLPVYAGHLDVFPSTFPYYKNGDVQIEKIINFAISMKHVNRVNIQQAAVPYINKSLLLSNLYQKLMAEYA